MDGKKIKPSYEVREGDLLTIKRSFIAEEVIVTGFSNQRRSASQTEGMYRETDESKERREESVAERRMLNAGLRVPSLKPSKQARRELRRLRSKT